MESPLIHDGSGTTAASDLSAKQFYAAQTVAAVDFQSDLASAATAIAGIIQNNPLAGAAVDLGILGVTFAKIGTGGVAAGDQLQVEAASGKLITKGAGVAVAIAMQAIPADAIGTVRLIAPAG